MSSVSIILISRNQDWNIARLIESVLRETEGISSREIILVDSASTDKTVDIASTFPITILRLHPDQHLSSHAGRCVGYKHCSGDLVLFLDGDMELYEGWLEKALQLMQDQPEVGALNGPWIDLPKPDQVNTMAMYKKQEADAEDKEVTIVGGAAIYRRSVLEQVGPFNPWLFSDGEPELCIRIRHAGFRIMRTGHPVAFHYSDPPGYMSTFVGRWKRKLYLGAGQNIRYHLHDDLLWAYVRERGYGLVPILGIILGISTLVASLVTGQVLWFGLWLSCFTLFVVTDVVRKRSLYGTLVSLLERSLIVDGTIRGFLMKPLDPKSFAPKLEVVREMTIENSDA